MDLPEVGVIFLPVRARKGKATQKGAEFEGRVERWLKRQGFETKTRYLARGKISKRPYEVDVYATKKPSIFSRRIHVWVECKTTRVKRVSVMKLVEAARDVKEAWKKDIEKWHPDILMLVSSSGFDVDAVELANRYRVYCVLAKNSGFEFIGKMSRKDFNSLVESKY